MSGYNAFSEFYDELTNNINYKECADYICTLLKHYGVFEGSCILDLACGTAKLTTELSKAGYDMIGVDSSEEMLIQARNNLFNNKQDALLICQDMLKLDLFGTVDAAVCTLDSLNHLPNSESVKKAIANVGLFMNPNGVFIFDVNTLYKHHEILSNNTFVYDCDNVYCVWQNNLHEDTVDISLDIFEFDGEAYNRYSEDFSETAYPLESYIEWLKAADFSEIKIYNELTTDNTDDKTQRAVFVARYIGKK